MQRAKRWPGAAAAYVEAIGGVGSAGDRLSVPLSDGKPVAGANLRWYYNMGICLRKAGKLDLALRAFRVAGGAEPGRAKWLSVLADAEEQSGNLADALTAQRRLVDLPGDDDPSPRFKLASLYDATGQWGEAQAVLAENLRRHPEHAASHQLQANVLGALWRWGGSFAGGTPGSSRSTFEPYRSGAALPGGGPEPVDATSVRRTWDQAVKLAPHQHTWRVGLAEACVAAGDLKSAIEHFQTALEAVEHSTGRWVLNVKQRWQFQLERTYHRLGAGRVDDPLFDCTVEPGFDSSRETAPSGSQQVAGFFEAEFTFLGMRVSGFVTLADCDHVDIFIDGTLIRSVNVGREGHFPRFRLPITRKTIAMFPHQAKLEVRTPAGTPLFGPGSAQHVQIFTPHGNGQLGRALTAGAKVDKKGVISTSVEASRERQERYLEVYSKVRDYFERHLGRSVFLMYGTLLGYYRDGDFIPGDDDFDAGYMSDKTDPVAVKEETKDIIVELVRFGFTVSFNLRGRLFRVQLERGNADGLHIDLRPLWFQDGYLWAHNYVRLPLTRDDFIPVGEGTLRGVPVSIPRNTEAFLRGHYGTGWKVPDPAFTYYPSEVEPTVRRNLARALISVAEYQELAARISREIGDSADAGRFVSVGSQNLYPLEDLIM